MNKKNNFETLLLNNKIEYTQICYIDYSGRLCGKLVPSSLINSISKKGVVFAKANLSFALDDHFANNAEFLANTGDFFANPDYNSFTILSHISNTARFFTSMKNDSNEIWDGCPKNKLIKIINKFEDIGIYIKISLEPEFTLLKKNENNYEPISHDGMFTMSGMNKINILWDKLKEVLLKANIKIEQIGKEYGPGQYEATWKYDYVIKSIENYLNYKDIVKSLASDLGYTATFMPKPFDNLPGNGLHVHISLWDKNDNEISCSNNKNEYLSEIGQQFLAGLLKHAHSLTALGCSSINSYKRITPGSWSPAHICWGTGNRSALIRVPGNNNRRHIELRNGDNTNNPYIYLNAILSAGLDGIKKNLNLEKPVNDDVGLLDDNLNNNTIKVLPRNLSEAISFLKKNQVMKESLGNIIFNELIKIKETEIRQYELTVHDWERIRYIENY